MRITHSSGSSDTPAGRTPAAATGLLCALLALLAACQATDHGPVTPGPPGNPRPAFEEQPDGVTLALQGDALNGGASHRLNFSEAAYGIRLSVAGHRGGIFTLELRDEYGSVQRHDRISSDTTIIDSGRTFNRPGFADAVFSNFSGRADLALREAGSVTELPVFQFPRAAGTTWTYARETETGGGNTVRDTVVITARPDTLIPRWPRGQRLYGLWEVRARTGGEIETCRVLLYLEEDGFAFIRHGLPSPWGSSYPTLADASKLRFPLRQSSRWPSGFIGLGPIGYYTDWPPGLYNEHAGVNSVGPVTIAGASFPEGYQVYQYWGAALFGEEVIHHEYMVVPNIGIVRMKTHILFDEPRQTWELLSFHIPGPEP